MPRGDKTGPRGEGPMTGRKAGRCTGNDTAGYENLNNTQAGFGRREENGMGRGFGNGAGRGMGRHRGAGMRNRNGGNW